MSGYSIPYASDNSIKKVVVGYSRASSSGGETSPEKAAEGADVSKDIVRRQRAFLAEIGVLEKGDSGYSLTEAGQEIGRALRHDREEEAKSPLTELLREWEATPNILDDIGPGYVSKDDVIGSVAYITDKEVENTRQVAGANGFVDLYAWAGILDTNEDGEYKVVEAETEAQGPSESLNDSDEEEPEDRPPEQPPQNTPNDGATPQTPENPPNFTDSPFEISLELTGDEDPESIKKLIIAVRVGLEADIGEEEDTEPQSDGGQRSDSEDNGDESLDSFLDD